LSSSSLLLHHSFTSKVSIPHKVVMIFWLNIVTIHSTLNIQNVIIGVWLFIIMFTYKNNCCWIVKNFPRVTWHVDESSIGGERWFMEVAITTSFDPIGTWGIEGFGCCKY
jgi:hypothetical protein